MLHFPWLTMGLGKKRTALEQCSPGTRLWDWEQCESSCQLYIGWEQRLHLGGYFCPLSSSIILPAWCKKALVNLRIKPMDFRESCSLSVLKPNTDLGTRSSNHSFLCTSVLLSHGKRCVQRQRLAVDCNSDHMR